MKKKIGILLLLLLGFFLFVAIRFFLLDTQNTFGQLRIMSSPVATIFINNVAIGKVPFEDKYKAGEYLLKLIPEENATQTASWQRKITIRKNLSPPYQLSWGVMIFQPQEMCLMWSKPILHLGVIKEK